MHKEITYARCEKGFEKSSRTLILHEKFGFAGQGGEGSKSGRVGLRCEAPEKKIKTPVNRGTPEKYHTLVKREAREKNQTVVKCEASERRLKC